MRRIVLLALTALAWLCAPAWAQIAAPPLLPATPGVADPTVTRTPSIVPTNPAVLGWPQPTRVAFGIIRAEADTDPFDVKVQGMSIPQAGKSQLFEGSYGGGVIAGSGYGLALDTISIQAINGSPPVNDDHTEAGVGMALGEHVALGANTHIDSEWQSSHHRRTSGYGVGASVRLGYLYLGAGAGIENFTQHAANADPADTNGDQNTLVAGIGYLSEGTLRLRAEAWAATLSGTTKPGGAGTNAQLQAANFELKWDQFVAGLEALNANGTFGTNSTGKGTLTWETAQVTLGMVNDHGFGLLYHYGFSTEQTKAKIVLTTATLSDQVMQRGKAQTVTLVWQY